MLARTALPAVFAAILLVRAACVSADPSGALLQSGAVIVPPAWAGVWDVYEETMTASTFQCVQGSVTTRSYRDTLCAGDTIQVFPSPYPAPLGCSGPVFTDTTLWASCSNWWACHACCADGGQTFIANWNANWSLSDDVATTTVTYSQQLSGPPPCSVIESCIKTTGTRTRVWPESSICGTVAVLRQTWGTLRVKLASNPSHGKTQLAYELPAAGHVRLVIYDIAGRAVSTLVDGRVEPGRHQAMFEPRDMGSSALLFYRLEWEGQRRAGSFVMLK